MKLIDVSACFFQSRHIFKSAKTLCGFGFYVDFRAGRHVVGYYGNAYAFAHGTVVLVKTALSAFVVVGGDDEQPVRSERFGSNRVFGGNSRAVAPRAYDDGNFSADEFDGELYDFFALTFRHGCRLAGGSEYEQRAGGISQLIVEQFFECAEVYAVFRKRRYERRAAACE